MFWNDPKYKPKNRICEVFWQDFMHNAYLLLILDKNKSREEKASPDYIEPDVYAVFNKMRQEIDRGHPYSKEFIRDIDRSVENEFQRDYGRAAKA